MMRLAERVLHSGLRLSGFRSRFVSTPIGTVHALDRPGRGDLAPVVLLHGLSASAADFAPLFRHLRGHRRIVAVDLFGHGLSAPIQDVPSAALHAALAHAIDAIVDEPAVVFGNSLGGLMAVRYALARPDQVSRLILASPGGAEMDAEAMATLLQQFRMETVADAREFMNRVLARPDWRSWAMAWSTRSRFSRRGVQTLLRRADPADLLSPAEIAGLRMPTLVLWGRADRVLPEMCREFFRKNLPIHAKFEEPGEYGHAPFLDDPEGLAARIAKFAA
jgi:pimeloyl-ACP methyl ester carboxylesterase